MAERDLATIEGVTSFLQNTPFASHTVTRLSGGYGNYTYRIHLRKGYHERETLVLKHAKPYLPGARDFAFPLERQIYEVGALRRVKAWLPEDSLVTVPAVHLFDEHENVIIMDDCGQGVLNLKELMLTDPPPLEVAETIGTALGEFIGKLHSRCTGKEEGVGGGGGHSEMVDFVNGNQVARSISALVTYGRLVPTLTGQEAGGLEYKPDPPLDVSPEEMTVVEEIAKVKSEQVMTSMETVVMGDFWPGNIMLSFNEGGRDEIERTEKTIRRIYVLDWELVKPGVAGLDVGQFIAEMHLLRCFSQSCYKSASTVIDSALKSYRGVRGGGDGGVARAVLIHVGAHLVAWTPRVPTWEGAEKVREVVLSGVRNLVDGYRGSEEGIKGSIVGELLGDPKDS